MGAAKRAFRARLPPILTLSTRYQTGWNVTKCHARHAKRHDNLLGNLRKGEDFAASPIDTELTTPRRPDNDATRHSRRTRVQLADPQTINGNPSLRIREKRTHTHLCFTLSLTQVTRAASATGRLPSQAGPAKPYHSARAKMKIGKDRKLRGNPRVLNIKYKNPQGDSFNSSLF